MEHTKTFLLIINGTSGVGKSTLAKKIHLDHKMSYLIDIDKIKSSFAHFRDNNSVSVSESVELCHAMCRHLLSKKFSVIIDRMLWNEFNQSVDLFEEIAQQNNAEFIHIHLTADLDTVVQRADERGYPKEAEGGLSRQKVINFHQRTIDSMSSHPEEYTIDTSRLTEDEVYQKAKLIIPINLND